MLSPIAMKISWPVVLVDTDLVRKSVIGTSIALVVLLAAILAGYTLSKSRTFQLAGEIVNRVDTTDKVVALTLTTDPPTGHRTFSTRWPQRISRRRSTSTAPIWTAIPTTVPRLRTRVTKSATTPTPTAG